MERKRSQSINVGSASIVMIFAVLCLTIFSTLSLLTANSEKKLAEKYAESVIAFYEADAQAEEVMDALEDGIMSGNPQAAAEAEKVKAVLNGDIWEFSYQIKIDENRGLGVELHGSTVPLDVIQWKQVEISDWSPNDKISVWDGE